MRRFFMSTNKRMASRERYFPSPVQCSSSAPSPFSELRFYPRQDDNYTVRRITPHSFLHPPIPSNSSPPPFLSHPAALVGGRLTVFFPCFPFRTCFPVLTYFQLLEEMPAGFLPSPRCETYYTIKIFQFSANPENLLDLFR